MKCVTVRWFSPELHLCEVLLSHPLSQSGLKTPDSEPLRPLVPVKRQKVPGSGRRKGSRNKLGPEARQYLAENSDYLRTLCKLAHESDCRLIHGPRRPLAIDDRISRLRLLRVRFGRGFDSRRLTAISHAAGRNLLLRRSAAEMSEMIRPNGKISRKATGRRMSGLA